jgi:hypothetical protein
MKKRLEVATNHVLHDLFFMVFRKREEDTLFREMDVEQSHLHSKMHGGSKSRKEGLQGRRGPSFEANRTAAHRTDSAGEQVRPFLLGLETKSFWLIIEFLVLGIRR